MLFTHNPQTPNSTHTGEFVDANKELLKTLPPPVEALEYYNGNDMYLFDEFQVNPKIPKKIQIKIQIKIQKYSIVTLQSFLEGLKRNRALTVENENQTGRSPRSRRPQIRNLYDVFCAIRDDELEHVKTMFQCQTVRERQRTRESESESESEREAERARARTRERGRERARASQRER